MNVINAAFSPTIRIEFLAYLIGVRFITKEDNLLNY